MERSRLRGGGSRAARHLPAYAAAATLLQAPLGARRDGVPPRAAAFGPLPSLDELLDRRVGRARQPRRSQTTRRRRRRRRPLRSSTRPRPGVVDDAAVRIARGRLVRRGGGARALADSWSLARTHSQTGTTGAACGGASPPSSSPPRPARCTSPRCNGCSTAAAARRAASSLREAATVAPRGAPVGTLGAGDAPGGGGGRRLDVADDGALWGRDSGGALADVVEWREWFHLLAQRSLSRQEQALATAAAAEGGGKRRRRPRRSPAASRRRGATRARRLHR